MSYPNLRMALKVGGLIIVFLLAFRIASGQESYTIEGYVTFQYEGDIYIRICTLEEWAEFLRPNYELSEPPWNLIKINSELKTAGEVSFKLDGIEKGTYVIVAFQDVIPNQKVDYEGLHMKEPWGKYKEDYYVDSRPRWDKIKFHLENNIGGIKIQL